MNKPFEKRIIADKEDAIQKAYAAGLLVQNGVMVAYGTGADRGTWSRFANIEFRGNSSLLTMDASAWFVNVHNHYHHNYSAKTFKHKRFCLTHYADEIEPLLAQFGICHLLENAMDKVESHDSLNDLETEWEENGKIDNWKERTMRIDIPIKDSKEVILAAIIKELSSWASAELIANAFTEGMLGLTLGQDDLAALMAGEGILSRYTNKTNKAA